MSSSGELSGEGLSLLRDGLGADQVALLQGTLRLFDELLRVVDAFLRSLLNGPKLTVLSRPTAVSINVRTVLAAPLVSTVCGVRS